MSYTARRIFIYVLAFLIFPISILSFLSEIFLKEIKFPATIFISIGGLIFALVLTLYFSFRFRRIVDGLVKIFERISDEEIAREIKVSGGDEIAKLYSSFNAMVDALNSKVERLKEFEEKFRSFCENIPIAIYRTTPDGRVILANRKLMEIFGFKSFDELQNLNLEKDFPFDYPRSFFKSKLEKEGKIELIARLRRTDGTEVIVRESARAVRDKNGNVIFYDGIIENITLEEKLREEVKLLYSALVQVEDPVLITDRDGYILYVNPAFEKLTGYTLDEVRGKTPRILKSGYHPPEFYKNLWDTILSGKTFRGIFVNKKKSGELYWERKTITPIKNEAGEITHFTSFGKDITADVKARERLEKFSETSLDIARFIGESQYEIEKIFAYIVEKSAKALEVGRVNIWKFTDDGKELRCLACFERSSRKHYLECRISVEKYPSYFKALRDGEVITAVDVELDPRTSELADDYWKVFNIRSSIDVPLKVGDKVIGVICFEHVGERRTWEKDEVNFALRVASLTLTAVLNNELLKNVEKIEKIFELAPAGIVFLDPEKNVVLSNSPGNEYLEIISGSTKKVEKIGSYPADEFLTNVGAGVIEISISEYSRKVFSVRSANVYNGWILLIVDITQIHDMQEKVAIQERLSAIGQVAAGIAHDFNNILGIIAGSSEIALLKGGENISKDVAEKLKIIKEQTQRASEMIRKILDFSRGSVGTKIPLDLISFIKENIYTLKRIIPENIKISFNYSDKEGFIVDANPVQIQQVILNLATNARDAMPNGGELKFELSRMEVKSLSESPVPGMNVGEWLVLSVSDTGIGIPPEILHRIFDPFFTTKEKGKGTGLGLSQVYGIVAQHGGFIDVKSRVGQGTTFFIYLPPSKAKEAKVVEKIEGEITKVSGTVLVVEDEPSLLEVVKDMFEQLGFKVLTAGNGKEALEIYAKLWKGIDFVVTDLIMPEMSGVELFENLKGINPNVKILIMTGYPTSEISKKFLESGSVVWIQKPFTINEMKKAIAVVLKS